MLNELTLLGNIIVFFKLYENYYFFNTFCARYLKKLIQLIIFKFPFFDIRYLFAIKSVLY
jgi:hypothetical protein